MKPSTSKNLLRLLLLLAVAYALYVRVSRPALVVHEPGVASSATELPSLATPMARSLATELTQPVASAEATERFVDPSRNLDAGAPLRALDRYFPTIPGYIASGEPRHTGLLEPEDAASTDPVGRAGLGVAGELAEGVASCFADAGVAATRVYRDEQRRVSAGLVGAAAVSSIGDASLVARCLIGPLGEAMLPSGLEQPDIDQDAVQPCARHYTLPFENGEHHVFYVGTTARVCSDFCAAIEGCAEAAGAKGSG